MYIRPKLLFILTTILLKYSTTSFIFLHLCVSKVSIYNLCANPSICQYTDPINLRDNRFLLALNHVRLFNIAVEQDARSSSFYGLSKLLFSDIVLTDTRVRRYPHINTSSTFSSLSCNRRDSTGKMARTKAYEKDGWKQSAIAFLLMLQLSCYQHS